MSEANVKAEPVVIEQAGEMEYICADRGGAQRIYAMFYPERWKLTWLNRSKSENGVTSDEWHGITRRYAVSSDHGCPDIPALVEWLEGGEGQALLTRICEGISVEYNHHKGKSCGFLDEDAKEAEEELKRVLADCPVLGREHAGVWAVGDWLQHTPPELKAESTDAEIEALAKTLESEAESERVVLSGSVEKHLKWQREKLQEKAEKAGAE